MITALMKAKQEEGRRNRQKILDALNKKGEPMTTTQLMAAVKEKHRASIATRLQRMREIGEVDIVGEQVVNGTKIYLYAANVTETVETFLKPFDPKQPSCKTAKLKPKGPWHTVNYSDDKPPIPRQGGQGAAVLYSNGSPINRLGD